MPGTAGRLCNGRSRPRLALETGGSRYSGASGRHARWEEIRCAKTSRSPGSDSGSASIGGTVREEALFHLITGRSQPRGLDIPPNTNILRLVSGPTVD